jgi:flagellar hook-basal body complex protein FliE
LVINNISKAAQIIDRNFVLQTREQSELKPDFADTLRSVLGEVNRMQVESDLATNEMLSGNMENLHQVMIKAEEAQLSLQLTVQVVNKVLQAYQEISRMQI